MSNDGGHGLIIAYVCIWFLKLHSCRVRNQIAHLRSARRIRPSGTCLPQLPYFTRAFYCVLTSPSLSTETCEFDSKAETLSSAMSALQIMIITSLAEDAYEYARLEQRDGTENGTHT